MRRAAPAPCLALAAAAWLALAGCGGSDGGGFLPASNTAVTAASFQRAPDGGLTGLAVTLSAPAILDVAVTLPGGGTQLLQSPFGTTHQVDFEGLPASGLLAFELRPGGTGAGGLPVGGRVQIEDPSGLPAPQITGLTDRAQVHPLTLDLTVRLDRPGDVEIQYWSAATPRLRVRGSGAGSHALLLAQMEPNSTYFFEVTPTAPGGGAAGPTWTGTLVTPGLPPGLNRVVAQASGQSSQLTFWRINMDSFEGAGDEVFQGIVAYNTRGQVVWYYQGEGSINGAFRRPNGNFVFGETDVGVREVDPRGQRVAFMPAIPGYRPHHDVTPTPADTVLVLTNSIRDISGEDIFGEAIWEWDPDTGATTLRWDAFDHLTYPVDTGPRTRPGDWLHANSIDMGPRGNVVMSLQFLDQVISIAPDFASLEWRIGGLNATRAVAADSQFFGQHTARLLDDDTLTLFDNHRTPNNDGGMASRALELDLSGTGPVTKSWEFFAPNGNWSIIVSEVTRLANGNTVVHFGASGVANSTGPIETYEVTPGGTVLFNLVQQVGAGVNYRGTPFPDIAGEELVP